ncbi:hemerythrin domain-containing protein [Brevibacillus dissolubilis]|uniref:hemerythrin domain-containing protein n=1 Tax=Brevibacillus dissolubilis TaxID=1844116 RepID=UPI0011179B07|nr:hemerythrin domain-containing protein [Brevibacillus dissolubilis]
MVRKTSALLSYYYAEHDELESCLDQFNASVLMERQWNAETEDLIAEFIHFVQHQLEEHMQHEEQVLFPAMAKALGQKEDATPDNDPISLMIDEHETLRRFGQMIQEEFTRCQSTQVKSRELVHLVYDFNRLLNEHIFKEASIVYPMSEQLLSAQQKESMLQQLTDDDKIVT